MIKFAIIKNCMNCIFENNNNCCNNNGDDIDGSLDLDELEGEALLLMKEMESDNDSDDDGGNNGEVKKDKSINKIGNNIINNQTMQRKKDNILKRNKKISENETEIIENVCIQKKIKK